MPSTQLNDTFALMRKLSSVHSRSGTYRCRSCFSRSRLQIAFLSPASIGKSDLGWVSLWYLTSLRQRKYWMFTPTKRADTERKSIDAMYVILVDALPDVQQVLPSATNNLRHHRVLRSIGRIMCPAKAPHPAISSENSLTCSMCASWEFLRVPIEINLEVFGLVELASYYQLDSAWARAMATSE